MKYLLRSFVHFLTVFLLLSFKSYSYIFDMDLLSVCVLQIFLPVCGSSIHTLNNVFQRAKAFSFNKVQLISDFSHGSCPCCFI